MERDQEFTIVSSVIIEVDIIDQARIEHPENVGHVMPKINSSFLVIPIGSRENRQQ